MFDDAHAWQHGFRDDQVTSQSDVSASLTWRRFTDNNDGSLTRMGRIYDASRVFNQWCNTKTWGSLHASPNDKTR